jgi:predicted O-linked N-acetylglucosamine transferase (SPINDLY family)
MSAFLAGDLALAISLSERALADFPSNPDANYLAGVVSYARGERDIAVEYLEKAILLGGERPAYLKDYGGFLASVGRHREGLAALRRALELDPDSVRVHSNLLFVISCCDQVSPEEVYAAHLRFGETVADPLLSSVLPHTNTREVGRILTIGYVSGDLRDHAVRYFIEPVLAGHDRTQFRIACYSNSAKPDEVSCSLRGYADLWRDISGLSDEAAARQIRADGVDILVDLSGHTSGNRLMMFARKPAPVQATWFGNVQTTGMRAIDWRITDARLDPEKTTEHINRERLARLPGSYACFRPHPGSPDVMPLPALKDGANGRITFGSFNSGHKINDAVAALWSRLINGIPGARLLLAVEHGDLPDICRAVAARFEAQGMAPGRIDIIGRKPVLSFLELFSSVDVMLDPFPQNGGITSLHALWMGVPFISLAGSAPIGRIGVSLLGQIGLDAFVAVDEADYIRIGKWCAENLHELAVLRAGLRARMQASSLMNERSFMVDLESAYRHMWRDWCDAF